MFNKLTFYTKIGYKLLKKDKVNNHDYRKEYNEVSDTYKHWLSEMGKHTDKIINSQYIVKDKELKILDFACGTGYITKALLEKDIKCKITAVDFSEGMLQKWRGLVEDKVTIIHCDGIEFLKNTEEKFDVIFFGWALSYFNYKELFKLFKKVLNRGGVVGIITNVQGTLYKIEDIFLKVMNENQHCIVKPMDIRLNLPKGKEGLAKWFYRYDFEPLEMGDGEVKFAFNEPEELLEWLNKTGATAGTAKIFNDYNIIKPKLIHEIKREKYKEGKYHINHKFAYGIFKLK